MENLAAFLLLLTFAAISLILFHAKKEFQKGC